MATIYQHNDKNLPCDNRLKLDRGVVATAGTEPLGSLVIDQRGIPQMLLAIGYMYEELFVLPSISKEERVILSRLAYGAVGGHPGQTAE
jgi:hypothetical protein